jgi:gamma-glutamyltranspeptidase/glutathione hydrolase
VVAAGHPATAEAGAEALRAGGNAVDAAISAALASFVCESPMTGFGAGGFMYIHEPGGADGVILDFFVGAGGSGMRASLQLARAGLNVAVLSKRCSRKRVST